MSETGNTGPGGMAVPDRLARKPAAGGKGGRRDGRNPFQRLVVYYREIVAELRKVIWPSRHELITYTSVVLVFVSFMIAYIWVLDSVFTEAVLRIFS